VSSRRRSQARCSSQGSWLVVAVAGLIPAGNAGLRQTVRLSAGRGRRGRPRCVRIAGGVAAPTDPDAAARAARSALPSAYRPARGIFPDAARFGLGRHLRIRRRLFRQRALWTPHAHQPAIPRFPREAWPSSCSPTTHTSSWSPGKRWRSRRIFWSPPTTQQPAIRSAGFLYLLIAHLGAIAILLCFGVLHGGRGDYTFDALRAAQLPAGVGDGGLPAPRWPIRRDHPATMP